MGYSYLVLGTNMGRAVAFDCLRHGDAVRVTVVDNVESNLVALRDKLNDSCLDTVVADVSCVYGMTELMRGYDVVVSTAPSRFNFDLACVAVASQTHFCDLGWNEDVVNRQFSLDDAVKASNLKCIPSCGIAPGAVSVVAEKGIREFRELYEKFPDYVKIRVGGIPLEPKPPLNYANVFSVNGVVEEYLHDAEVLRNGKLARVESLTGLERVKFEGTFGALEAAYTAGGSLTLAKTYEGKIRTLDYKTLRYPGHWQKMRALKELGYFDDSMIDVDGAKVSRRRFTERLLEDILPADEADAMVARVLVGGRFQGEDAFIGFDLIHRYNSETGLTAMQETTGFSAAILAQMMVRGDIKRFGVLRQEEAVDPCRFILEWGKRGIQLGEFHRNQNYFK